jgi:hypothetical protein
MKRLLFILLLSTTRFLYAQDAPYYPMRSWMISDSDTSNRYIFADTAFIRITPDTKQAPIDTLLAGDNITVTGVSANSLSIRGIKGPWLNISYTKNGERKSGYVWQGLVSLSPLRRGDTRFVFGIERRADSIYQSGKSRDTIRRYLARLKVVQNSKILAKAAIIIPDDESANTSGGRLMSGMGLTNVQNIIVLAFSGEACGVPSYDYYLAWTKDSVLVRFPDKMNVGDAGAFYHSENFTFPNEKNGKPDMILWDMMVEEETEKVDKNGDAILKVTDKKSTSYAWDAVNRKITKVKK